MVQGGILSKSSLPQIWRENKDVNKSFPSSFHERFLSLLEQLDVLIPYNSSREQFLVPCLLQDTVPSSQHWKKMKDGSFKREVSSFQIIIIQFNFFFHRYGWLKGAGLKGDLCRKFYVESPIISQSKQYGKMV